ncbi:gliding motility-associated C-terminal domain-containing protein [Pedobacter sp. Leaf250]|uniref:gliding motility-associated C-terminal domain-containing protein n=1 Tax=Pedobacter sp. Leaf250 TaxID=2876559 RepID=UPI001E51A0FA|nr:gliding motility-associated C-terminal domain-containing protein [Pedobacter sp. Leaf250]
MRYLILFLGFLFFNIAFLHADTFTVINNLNSGTGSLRDAIERANTNGTADVDYIYFNLPGSSLADVTIALETELPILTANIIIDGTTQPFSALGNPNIKISLTRVVATYFNGLRMDNANKIEVYGLLFGNFQSDPLGAIEDKKGGIYLYNSKDIVVGAPNKPNCFVGCYAGILSPFVIPKFFIENVKISSNIFGLAENGLTVAPNETGIDISFIKGGIIGGDTPEEGNLVTGNTRTGIALGGAEGIYKIANNIIGLDKNFNPKPTLAAKGIYVNGGTSAPIITDNIVGVQSIAIHVDYVNDGFVIARNKIGTGKLGTENFSNTLGIHINFSNTKGLIGGSNVNDQNFIAYNKTAILVENSYPIAIFKNSIYCNSTAAITFKNQSLNPAKISLISASEVSGVYSPNSIVELFYTDECNDCQGKTWFATVPTDAAGFWKYTGSIAGKITSLGTDANGATSNFSKPLIDDTDKQIIDPFCGQTTGSIKNLKVYNASVFQWFNSAGLLVGNTKDLENVPAGTYYLKAGQMGACDVTSTTYTIGSLGNGIDDSNKRIADEICGASNGSIKNIGVANNLAKTWYNQQGDIVGNGSDLGNIPAGSYFFKAGENSCEITSPVYVIKNVVKNYVIKNVIIKPASCGNSNGSITIQSYQTDKPVLFIWKDADGNAVGNNENLTDVSAGTYTLAASDGLNCENIAGSFTIESTENPIIDLTTMQSFISCDGKTINITDIQILGSTSPYNFQWIDPNGNVVYNELNLTAKPGKYYLKVVDKYGCEITSEVIDLDLLEKKKLQVPNSITPNGDGVNDTWRVPGAENYPNAEFFIFNRTGGRIFHSIGYDKEFDGTYNGKPLNVGVYYYVIDLKTDCGKLTGSLTILK